VVILLYLMTILKFRHHSMTRHLLLLILFKFVFFSLRGNG